MPQQRCASVVITLAALLAPGAASATCIPTSPSEISRLARDAELAFVRMDDVVFLASRDAALDAAGCLHAAPSPADAAALHEILGLSLFHEGDLVGALSAFHAMYAALPIYEVPAEVAPEGGPLRSLVDGARTPAETAAASVRLWTGWSLIVDGTEQSALPLERSALVTVLDPMGRVSWSDVLATGEPLPAWIPLSPTELPPVPSAPPTMEAPRARALPLVAAGAGVVTAGLLTTYAVYYGTYSASDAKNWSRYGQVFGLRQAALVGAGATTALGVGALGVAVHDRRELRISAGPGAANLGFTW